MTLTDLLLQSALERIDSPDVIGVGIVGSYARGQESNYSDIDFDIFVSKLPENPYDRYTLHYWDNKLISLKYTLLDDERAALINPRRAIWAVPGLRGMKIVLEAVAVQRGLMIISENRYFDLIQDSVGRDSAWNYAFRTAWGLGTQSSQYKSRGVAALALYSLSAELFESLIPEKYHEVVMTTLRLIKEAGYL